MFFPEIFFEIRKLFDKTTRSLGSVNYGNISYGASSPRAHNYWYSLPKNQHTHYWILRTRILGRCQKVPKFDFHSQFSMSKIIGIFLNFFFQLKNTILGAHFFIDIFWYHQSLNYFINKNDAQLLAVPPNSPNSMISFGYVDF